MHPRALLLVLTLLCSAMVSAAETLPPKDEMHRLMLAAEQAVKASQWENASRFLTQLQSLKVDKPVEYLFLRGQIMYHDQQYDEASSALRQYVLKAGDKGKHYDRALELITAIDEAQRKQAQSSPEKTVATIKPAGTDEIKKLEKLYLTDNPQTALLTYINGQLSQYAWRGKGKIIRMDSHHGVRYSLSASGNGKLMVRTTTFNASGDAVVTFDSMDVFGINPMVKSGCESTGQTCWIYDPRDGSRWLRLGPDADAAADIAHAITNLLRVMQRS